MGLSYSTVSTSNMELSPCKVTFDSVDLGGTLGNVVIGAKYMKAPIKADQLGETVLDRRVSGLEITVTTEVAEIVNKDNWKVVFPHADLIGAGPKALQFNSMVGDSDSANAKLLKLHPLSTDPADADNEHHFFKAISSAESALTFSPTEQARLKIVWNVLPDLSVTPPKFYRFGDTTI